MSPRSGLQVGQLEAYLLAHKHPPTALEFLARDGDLWLVRWPAGSVRWESAQSLHDRGFVIPRRPLLDASSPLCVAEDP